jgi:hypothetical protein
VARLYGNENFPLPVVETLRKSGHDVLTVIETGRGNQAWPDEAVLAFATAEKRVLLTLNRKHFIRLHERTPDHAGIVTCTFDRDFSGQAQRIDAKLREAGEMAGKLIRVNRPNVV